MAYLVLARKYRPGTFESFVGQDVIHPTDGLQGLAHYFFAGSATGRIAAGHVVVDDFLEFFGQALAT